VKSHRKTTEILAIGLQIDLRSRNEIHQLLLGLRAIYNDRRICEEVFTIGKNFSCSIAVGCFYNDATFMVSPPPDTGELAGRYRSAFFISFQCLLSALMVAKFNLKIFAIYERNLV
jgi:hypothetical protein